MLNQKNKKYLFFSIAAHISVLLILVLSVNFSSPLPVFENTNKNDVISAVVLGDTQKSKILPQQKPAPQPLPKIEKPEPKPEPIVQAKKTLPPVETKKDVIALKAVPDKKKLAEEKALAEKKRQELLAKEFLTELNTIKEKQKKKQKVLKSQFDKMLKEQAEKSLREQFLEEDFKLKSMQSRQSQGEVNKYKALILQAISEHWIVPTQANRKLYCELMIRVAPGGVVLDVQVTKSSGDPSLDSSARAAVMKASPLPVPKDAGAFEAFKQFVLKVKPENVIG